ncbi:hypothetical protein AA0312_1978 [Acetobacter tropicalis NRIC 0312]|nr:hypothetical protein ATR1_044c0002 [Acetobacter tropicalis]GBR70684.1 hypothetical protein AA0312_1978 [Acetobacter tropicalis NRIC 0312]
MGLKSGLYGGRNISSAPAYSMAFYIAGSLYQLPSALIHM